ncbi:MAG: hypothetical protein LBS97_06770 [Treponema sp.]|jgi:hypothetical protein|nr:hypothetical protein [Treponema sp.]
MKRTFLFFGLIAATVMMSSCRTTYYGESTANFPVVREGKIVQKGSVKKLPKDAIAVIGKASAPLRLLSPVFPWSWEGTITVNGNTQDVAVDCQMTKLIISTPDITKVTVDKMPGQFSFTPFDIPRDTMVMKADMPARLADFSINGKAFTLRVSGGQTPFPNIGMPIHPLLRRGDQRYLITDEAGTVYAEFTKKAYTIFQTGDMVTVEDIQQAIGVCSVIPRISESADTTVKIGNLG